jgi:YGGT family
VTYVRDPNAAPGPVNVNDPGYNGPAYVAGPTPVTIARRLVDTLFGILELLLVLRILLLALGANSGNALVDGIYNITEPFVAPFIGVFNINHVHPMGSSVIDVAAIVAMVGWAILALIIDAILRVADRRAAA